MEEFKQALENYHIAQNLFAEATGLLVDEAVYNLNCAETRLMRIIQERRLKNV